MVITEDLKLSVWNKWKVIPNNKPNEWRQDECWAWIWFQFYWNRNNQYGWEIDHITPQSNWWNDNLSNLRPLQWENNISKSDWRLVCKITADWTQNVKK